jgi:hypothetical protein
VDIHWTSFGNVDEGISVVDFRFQIDLLHWEPIVTSAGGTGVVYSLASERIGTEAGWTVTRENAGGAPAANGDWIHVEFDGNGLPANSWASQPYLNLQEGRTVPVVWLAFTPSDTSSQGVNGGVERERLVLDVDTLDLKKSAALRERAFVWAWEEVWLGSQAYKDNTEAQAVDWLVRPHPLADEHASRVQLRTLITRLIAHGQQLAVGPPYPDTGHGDEAAAAVSQFKSGRIVPPHPLGLFQVAMAADESSSMTQILDLAQTSQSGEISVPKVRVESTFPGTLRFKDFFGAPATAGYRRLIWSSDAPKWGHPDPDANPGEDRALAAGVEHARVAVSSSVTGATVEAVYYGTVRGWAEKLAIVSAQADVRPKGRRRFHRR